MGWSPGLSLEGHHAVRDENYLIETFSFIYYSVSERCHLARREGRGAVAPRKLLSRMRRDSRARARARERERERVRCSPRTAHLVAFIEKLSRSIAIKVRSCADQRATTTIVSLDREAKRDITEYHF